MVLSNGMTSEAPAGAWLFRYRSFLAGTAGARAACCVRTRRSRGILGAGRRDPCWSRSGEGLRLWAVRHIGTISRTRTTRYGPLMTAGPYAIVRNPLYVGNWFLWTGFAVWSAAAVDAADRLAGVRAPVPRDREVGSVVHPQHLHDRAYDEYARQVRAWLPRWPPTSGASVTAGAAPSVARGALQRARHAPRRRVMSATADPEARRAVSGMRSRTVRSPVSPVQEQASLVAFPGFTNPGKLRLQRRQLRQVVDDDVGIVGIMRRGSPDGSLRPRRTP